MKVIYCAQLVEKEILEKEFLNPLIPKLKNKNFNDHIQGLFKYSKTSDFFVKKINNCLNIFGNGGKNFCTRLFVNDQYEIELLLYNRSIFDLKEEDLKIEAKPNFWFNFCMN